MSFYLEPNTRQTTLCTKPFVQKTKAEGTANNFHFKVMMFVRDSSWRHYLLNTHHISNLSLLCFIHLIVLSCPHYWYPQQSFVHFYHPQIKLLGLSSASCIWKETFWNPLHSPPLVLLGLQCLYLHIWLDISWFCMSVICCVGRIAQSV